jgi:hypothetical protein
VRVAYSPDFGKEDHEDASKKEPRAKSLKSTLEKKGVAQFCSFLFERQYLMLKIS